jgi:Mce-associated membrane protein
MSTREAAKEADGETVTETGGKVSLPRRIARRAGRIPAGWRIAIVTVLTLLVAGSGVAAGLLDTQTSNNTSTQQERDAAVAAAKTEIPQILSYNYKTLSADLARASADTTGQFSGQFGVLASQLIGPNATKQQTVTKAAVPVAAAVDSSGNEVTVLVFVDQSTTSKTQPKAQTNSSQLRVTMQKVNGRWLVEQFTAL